MKPHTKVTLSRTLFLALASLLLTAAFVAIRRAVLAPPSLLFALSLLFVGALILVWVKLQPGLSPQFIERLRAILAGEVGLNELAAPFPGASGPTANQLRELLSSHRQRMTAMEEALAASQINHKVSLYTKHRFESIFEEFPDGVMLLDESAVATYANSKIELLLGQSKEAICGHKFHDWAQDEALSAFFARFQTLQSRLRRKQELIFTPAYLKGHTLSIGAYPIENREQKTFHGTLVLCRDVTAEALAKQARGDFVAHVAHELKSPLNVLAMYSELLMGEEGNDSEVRTDAANVIADEVERLALLINNLLSISKIEMGSIGLQRQRVKLIDLLSDAFQTVSRSGKGEGLDFRLELPHELSPVSLDKELFRVALNNLLTNAIKYNRPGGTVTLSAEETENQIVIVVKDTGLGISEADQARVFDKFFRSESDEVRQRPGHGLGLALAKNIIDVHHGRLKLESVPGQGTTFSILLDKGMGLVQEGV